jgi:hypothetical protein
LDDDWKEPDFIKVCVDNLHDDIALSFTQAKIHFENNSQPDSINLPPTASAIYPSEETINFIMNKTNMTLSPSCCLMRRSDAVKHLITGKLPYTSKVWFQNDCFMMLAILSKYPKVAYIADELCHFNAIEGGFTIDAVKNGGEKFNEFLKGYAEVKQAYLKLKEGL